MLKTRATHDSTDYGFFAFGTLLMRAATAHAVKYRNDGRARNDVIFTPRPLAYRLIQLVPMDQHQTVLDGFRGDGAFFDQFPEWVIPKSCEITDGTNFFEWLDPVDWVVSNPPYSRLDDIFRHTAQIVRRGFAYLLAAHAITPARIALMEASGLGLTRLHLCKVFAWYGISAFAVFERDRPSILQYDREVWR